MLELLYPNLKRRVNKYKKRIYIYLNVTSTEPPSIWVDFITTSLRSTSTHRWCVGFGESSPFMAELFRCSWNSVFIYPDDIAYRYHSNCHPWNWCSTRLETPMNFIPRFFIYLYYRDHIELDGNQIRWIWASEILHYPLVMTNSLLWKRSL